MRQSRSPVPWYLPALVAGLLCAGCGLLQKTADVVDDPQLEDDATDDDAQSDDADDAAPDVAADADAGPVDAAAGKDADAKDAAAQKDTSKDGAADVAKDAVIAADGADAQDAQAPDAAVDVAADVAIDSGPTVCTSAQIAACDDGKVCTDDACDPATGCSHTDNALPCDDGSACTKNDACQGGVCAGILISCDDAKACTTDTCKPSFGCLHQNASGPCNDGNICTTGESCTVGVCIGGAPADCGDGVACTLDTCDPATGCQHSSGDGPCDDGNFCTVGEACVSGVCGGGSAALCDDGNACTSDSCDPPSGCTFTEAQGACADVDPCAAGGVCTAGSCVSVPLVCVAADLCHSAGVCNNKTGTCDPVNAQDGVSCDDGLPCTLVDTCKGGACVGANQCDDHEACTLDACLKSGACAHTVNCTVGGAVTGLIGPGLTVASGPHVLGISQDGAFELPGGFINGANYFVTVTTSPGSPPQRCSVLNASGSIAGSCVSNVAITCSGCGNGVVDSDPVSRLEFEWLANTQTPASEYLDCAVNGQAVLHVDAATADWFCDTLPRRQSVTVPAALGALLAGNNTVACQFKQNVAWIIATAHHASGRAEQVVVYDFPNDAGGLTDAIHRNSACPGYGFALGDLTATLPIALTEACDDGNLDEGDGCSSLCLPEACTTGMDADGDGLDDCYETATGVLVDAQHTGTSPLLWDTDGDGLSDGDELLGTSGGLDLAALGANPLRQDVFVESDWMVDNDECGPHSHQITPGAEALAVKMFANAPHVNPDRTTGIALHIDYGQGGKWLGGGKVGTVVEYPLAIGPDLAALKAAHFDANRLGYFHYNLMIHSIGPDAGGIGELTGDDFIVASGGCDVCYKCKGTDIPGHLPIEAFCHELGHNLGLAHGGDSACNGKANYPSIMNYRHAYYGIDVDCDDVPDGNLDYSRGDRPVLSEAALKEADGVCGGSWIDWDGDGKIGATVAMDLNADYNATCGSGAMSVMTDHDDWGRLSFAGILTGVSNAKAGARKAAVCYDDPLSKSKRAPR